MISKHSVQKVIEQADVMDVVGNFVQLKRRGANYLGLCPFHNEKTPSFTVSPSKGIYKCFGCSRAGNAVSFVQEHERLSFPESIEWLAKRYNIELEMTEMTQEQKNLQKDEESLRIINEFASQYFHNNLYQNEEGRNIGLSYFQERGLSESSIQKFQLGYALENKSAFHEWALAKAYQKDFLIMAGLVGENQQGLYDKYAGRVIFPIQNQSGKVIGFGARILKSNAKTAKYINTPENPIYNKSKTLYGIFQAKKMISQLDECLLVEGYTDVISLHQGGIENTVASSGTSLTEGQLYMIKRYTKNVTILYDGDAAGIKAALRGMDMALEIGMHVQMVLLPENHDPDSFIKAEGASYFIDYIKNNKKDFILFRLETSLVEAKNDSVKKAQLINEIAETISHINKIEDFTKQQDYIRRCAELLQIEEGGLIQLVNKKIREKLSKKRAQQEPNEFKELEKEAQPEIIHNQDAIALTETDYKQEKSLLRVLLQFGEREYNEKQSIAEFIISQVDIDDFNNDAWKNIFTIYAKTFKESLQFPDLKYFTYHENEAIRKNAIEAIQQDYEVSKNWTEKLNIYIPREEEIYREDVEKTIDYFYLRKIKNYFKTTMLEMKELAPEQNDDILNLQKFIQVLKIKEKEIMQKHRIASIG